MITLHQVEWGPEHDAEIMAAMNGDPLADLGVFRGMVAEGAAILWDFRDETGARLGCALVTAEQVNGHNQAVIIAGTGRQQKPGQLRAALAALVERLQGFDSIRTHVKRPALVRLWGGMGFTQTEIVLRRDHGQSVE